MSEGPADWPEVVETAADLDRVAKSARRDETRCGRGHMVWRRFGPPGAPPLLLLHGGSGSWAHWVRNLHALVQAGWCALVPDMPGFGESAGPGQGHDADALPEPIEQGLRLLVGLQALPVVGFSFGALVAGYLAEQFPQRMSRLVLVGAPALSDELVEGIELRSWMAAPAGEARDAVHRHNLRQLMLAHDDSVTALALAIHAAGVERDRMRRRRLMMTTALRDRLPGFACPMAGIWGRGDVLVARRHAMVERVLGAAPRFEGVRWIDGAGHWVAFEQARAFDAALAAALAGAA